LFWAENGEAQVIGQDDEDVRRFRIRFGSFQRRRPREVTNLEFHECFFSPSHFLATNAGNLPTSECSEDSNALDALLLIVILYRRWQWLALPGVLMAIHLPWYASTRTTTNLFTLSNPY
jgi:hypothetical protein